MTKRHDKLDKLWTPTFVLLTLVQTMDLMVFHTITPVIAKFTILQGVALTASGLAASVFSLASIFARPLSGFLADRLGRRSIVLASIAVSVAMQLGYALIPGFAPLLVMRIVHGFFYALFGTALSAMALSTLPESRKNEGMGWFGASYVVAAIIGPAMGVALSDAFGFTTLFLVTASIAALSFPLAAAATAKTSEPPETTATQRMPEEPAAATAKKKETPAGSSAAQVDPEGIAALGAPAGVVAQDTPERNAEQGVSKVASQALVAPEKASDTQGAPEGVATQGAPAPSRKLKPPALRDLISVKCIPLAGIAMCFMAIWGMIASYIVLVGEARQVDGIALFFVVNSATLFVTRPALGKITDRHGLSKLILPAIAIETTALLGICLAHQLWLFLLAGCIKAFGSGGVLPSIQAECGRLETPERAGVAMSTYLLASDIGYTIGPLLGGLLASAVGYDAMLFGSFPIVALALIIYITWRQTR